ncbi:unnamed protein product [Dicrocoelium dendriticum]|nr:unnamed protein product [Dicrocoelium dendriticum]
MDPQQLEKDGVQVLELIRSYWNGLLRKEFPVLPDFRTITPGFLDDALPREAPEDREDIALILEDYKKLILPGIVHWQHPDFHAFYPMACTAPAMLGNMIADSIGIFSFSTPACPTATQMEVIVLNWLAHAFGLPSKFIYGPHHNETSACGGGISASNSSVAAFIMAMAIRNHAALQKGSVTTDEDRLCGRGPAAFANRSVVYLSDQTNCSISRAAKVAMLKVRVLQSTYLDRRLVVGVDEIQKAMKEDRENGYIPLMVKSIIYMNTVFQFADSFCFNPHKTLLVNTNCCTLWIADYKILTNTIGMDPVDLQTAFTKKPVSMHHQLAMKFAELIQEDIRFEVVNDVRFGLVCFKLKAGDWANHELVHLLTEERLMCLSMGTLPVGQATDNGRFFLRFVSNQQAELDDMELAVKNITRLASRVLLENQDSK